MQKKFSFPVKIDELNQNSYHYVLEADEAEREDIAQILQVEGVNFFKGEVHFKLNKKENMLRLWGKVEAILVLQSVISLENFEEKISAPFELFFDTKATYKDIKQLEAANAADVPDIIENGEINLADICIEQVALKIDDYPRAKGEIFDFSKYSKIEPPAENNPFAVLEKLKK